MDHTLVGGVKTSGLHLVSITASGVSSSASSAARVEHINEQAPFSNRDVDDVPNRKRYQMAGSTSKSEPRGVTAAYL